ncbi:MAG TPA: phosphatase PAP2 family protein [Vicinamibacterales bacterium]|nr:phosphatase PAP2 family protein [Vicinamibacterales bacterium]
MPTSLLETGFLRRERGELALLLGALALILLGLAFFALAGDVLEGDTQRFDERVLRALRRPDQPDTPIGPRWLRIAALDITALGSASVLGLTVAAIVGFLWLQRMRRMAVFVLAASVGGWVLNNVLKTIFQRPRPDVVSHLRDVMPLSFPSGHAMTSAAIYLTLGALLMRVAERPLAKIYCMAVAMIATFMIGLTRVYLGVHYPTDVLAGWLIGICWALLCWLVERLVERRVGIRRERQASQNA